MGIVGLICVVVFGIVPYVAYMDVSYEGQEVFLIQENFETFKDDFKYMVYEDSLKLGDFDVLASEPPIIVNFEVTVPYSYDFPYGNTQDRISNVILAATLSFLAVFCLVVIPTRAID